MRISIAILSLSLLLGSSVASARTPHRRARVKRNNFGTFKVNGAQFKLRRYGKPGRGRRLTITSRNHPGAMLLLSRTFKGELRVSPGIGKNAAQRSKRLMAELGFSGSGAVTTLSSGQLAKYQGTVFARLGKMALVKPVTKRTAKKPATPTKKPTSKNGQTRRTYQEVATRKGAIQGGVVYSDRYTVVTTPGKDGGKVISSDGSSVQLEGWRLRRLITGGPSNSYSGRNLNIRIR